MQKIGFWAGNLDSTKSKNQCDSGLRNERLEKRRQRCPEVVVSFRTKARILPWREDLELLVSLSERIVSLWIVVTRTAASDYVNGELGSRRRP